MTMERGGLNNFVGPTPPPGDNSNRLATTAFVTGAGGGGGTPGGATTDVQFNNAGAFGGVSDFVWTPSAGPTTQNVGLNITGASGFRVESTDANIKDPSGTFATAAYISGSYDKLVVSAPNFSDVSALGVDLKLQVGQNNYGSDAGGAVTRGKLSSIPLSISQTSVGSGQHFAFTLNSQVYGMSDAFLFSGGISYATGPIAGDEGQGFCPAFYCFQQNRLAYGIVSSVTRTTYSSTVTNIITGSQNAQPINVASTTGATVGDWVVFNQAPPDSANLICASQISAIGTNGGGPFITCIVPINFSISPSAPTVTPAMVLGVGQLGSYPFGQDRVLVNLSGASYSAGKASSAFLTSTTIIGDSSTNWSSTMVGGNANNIGAISFDIDTYSNAPFDNQQATTSSTSNTVGTGSKTFTILAGLFIAPTNTMLVQRTSDPHNQSMTATVTSYSGTSLVLNVTAAVGSGTFTDWTILNTTPGIGARDAYPLRSWYQIINAGTPDNHHLTIRSQTVTNTTYGGNVPINPSFTGGTYIIQPAARILLIPNNSTIICETTTSTWSIGDTVECVICPYPDLQGFDFRIAQYNAGGAREQFLGLTNSGARSMTTGLSIKAVDGGNVLGLPGSDTFAFLNGISLSSCKTGIFVSLPPNASAALEMNDIGASSNTDSSSIVKWTTQGGTWSWGKTQANGGLTGLLANSRLGTSAFRAVANSTANNPYALPEIEWEGWLRLAGDGGFKDPILEFGSIGVPTASRIQLCANLTSGGNTSAFGALGGMDLNSVTGSTPTTLLSIAGPVSNLLTSFLSFFGVPQVSAANSSSGGSSFDSAMIALVGSRWAGNTPAAQFAPVFLASSPAAVGTNQLTSFKVKQYIYTNNPSTSFLEENLAVDSLGAVTFGCPVFGARDAATGGSYVNNPLGTPRTSPSCRLDPVNMTVPRTVVLPDMSGGNLVVQPTSTGVPGTSQANGTAGEVRWDTTHIYVCFATGTGAADRWLRSTAASSW
jgi:hypothetical protein